jgi:2'-5' RNA ligase
MSDRWRCFVAVPIGEELREALAGAVEAWRARADLAGLRWTDPAGWHLTLAFLGPTGSDAIPGLVGALERVAPGHAPLRLATGGLGAFPSRAHARVAWYGVADPERRLTALAREVTPAVGLEGDARFRAHVTLARARSEPIDARPWLEGAAAPAGELVVDRMELMRSHLGRGPAHYETLATVPLGVLSRG